MDNRIIKIAYLDFSPVFAGAERVLFNAISNLDRSKYEPILVFPYPRPHQERYKSLDCEKIWLNRSRRWWMGGDYWKKPLKGSDLLKRAIFGLQLARFIRKNNIQVLDVNLMRNDIKMWVWGTRKFTDAKIIGHYRSQSLEWIAPADGQCLFDLIVCVSEFSRSRFLTPGEFCKTGVLYDAVNIDEMQSSLSKEEAKKALGLDPSWKIISSVGQLSIHKGHDTAIRALARLKERYPDYRLLIAGGGRDSLVKYYQDIIKEERLEDRVIFPGKQLGDIQTVYRASDLTLSLTKVGEGFGLVPYESTLLGTPFIAPSFGAVMEFVKDGENGMLVDTNNLDDVIDKIDWALSHTSETREMVRRLQQVIYDKLTPRCLADNLDTVYSELLKTD